MNTKIVLVLSLATFLGLATGCASTGARGTSSHAAFTGAPEYSGLTLPGAARLRGDPRAEPSRLADAPVPYNSAPRVAAAVPKDSTRAHVL
jgi:hypothetical protein